MQMTLHIYFPSTYLGYEGRVNTGVALSPYISVFNSFGETANSPINHLR